MAETLQPTDEPKGLKKKLTVRTAAAKQRRVLHEVDKGAPCLECGDKCPGFELHFWRKRCEHCLCPRENHEVGYQEGMNRPTAKIIKDDKPVEEPAPKRVRTAEERRKMAHQDPLHDHDTEACSSLADENQINSFMMLNDKRNEMYGVGVPKKMEGDGKDQDHGDCHCKRCDKHMHDGDDMIEAPGVGVFCPDHFSCFNCHEELMEHNYYEYEGEIYCGRCHAELFMPRCAGCDELIFDPTYTVAEGKKWHLVHFCCWVCDIDLCEKQYAKDPEDHPCCLPCYNDKYAVQCGTCKKPITAGEKAMRAGDKSYHHTDDCFRCAVCKDGLEGKKCVQYQDELYCSACYHDVHSPPCGRCQERVRGEFVEVRGKRYHKACFNCFDCGTTFTREEKKGAYPVSEKLLCYKCALEQRRQELRAAKEAKAKEDAPKAESTPPPAAASKEEAKPEDGGDKPVPKQESVPPDEPTEAKTSEGGALLTPGQDKGNFVRQGTRRATVIPKKQVEPTPEEKSAMEAAVAKAEQDAENGDDDDDDDNNTEATEEEEIVVPEETPVQIPTQTPTLQVLPESEETTTTPSPEKPARHSVIAEEPEQEQVAKKDDDPYAALWAGFSIPMKLSKFKLDIPGREILDIGSFTLIEKKVSCKVFLVLCTDVALICNMVDEDCYELMCMPVERNKVKAKLVKNLPGVVGMKLKIGKWYTLKVANEIERSQWVGKLNAPIGFIPTKALG
eukprot:m.334616 g.334616  ORF g.334616 m.334616 type:complete len:729 (+) comp17399_c0_seq1:112-2298(+)